MKVHSLLFMSSLNMVLSGGEDRVMRLYSLRSNSQVTAQRGGHQGIIYSIARTGEDSIATGSSDQKLRLYDLNRGLTQPSETID